MSKLELFLPEKPRSNRQLKVAEELRHILSKILLEGDFPPLYENGEIVYEQKTPVTITHLNISPDLKNATVYIMPLMGKEQEEVKNYFMKLSPYFRHLVAKKISLRSTPAINFKIDNVFSDVENIDNIFSKISNS